MNYMFMMRSYWLELSVPQNVVINKYKEYFGNVNLEISTRKGAVDYLLELTGKIQEKMVKQLQGDRASYLIKDLYKQL